MQEQPCHRQYSPQRPQDLFPAEQIVLSAARLWTQRFRCHCEVEETMHRFFAWFDLARAAASLDTIMRHSAMVGTRPLDIHAVTCPCLSRDEESIVHAIAYVQRGAERAAIGNLERWLPAAAARLTLPAMQNLADALAGNRFCVPLREWDVAPSPAPKPHRPAPVRPQGVVLH